MSHKPKTQDSQSQKFKKAARELGCDESETAFEKRLRKIAQAPKSKPKKRTPAK